MWQPDPISLQQLATLLEQSSRRDANQKAILDQLDAHRGNPDFNNYLAFLFASNDGRDEVVRFTAGLILKNNVKAAAKPVTQQTPDVSLNVAYIRQSCMAMLQSDSRQLRQTAGTLAVALLEIRSLDNWPELVQYMVQVLQSGTSGAREGVLTMLYKIVEDQPFQLTINIVFSSSVSEKPVNVLMPHVAALFSTVPDPEVRYNALKTFNMLVTLMPEWLVNNLDAYVRGLLSLAEQESDSRIHREVCLGANQLLQQRAAALEPHLDHFINYILRAMQHSEHDVAIEATTFWTLFTESSLPVDRLMPYLDRLIELLFKYMVFEEHDEEVVAAQEAERGLVRDSDADVKPFLSARDHEAVDDNSADGGDDRDEPTTDFTLRRSCAQTLDYLSHELEDTLLPRVLAIVEQHLNDADWRLREVAILALGAIADGCAGGLEAHVPGILKMLTERMRDPQPIVRINSCWAAGRFVAFVVRDAVAGSPPAREHTLGVLSALMDRLKDHNSAIHYAALSALASTFEEVKHQRGSALVHAQATELVRDIMALLPKYSRKVQRQAYETLIQTVQCVEVLCEDPQLVSTWMTPLLGRLTAAPDTHIDIMPILDTLIHLVLSLGGNVEPYAVALLQKAVATATVNLAIGDPGAAARVAGTPIAEPLAAAAAAHAGCGSDPMHALQIAPYALDLICALVEALHRSSEALLSHGGSAGATVPALCLAAASSEDAYVCQSGLALIGEICQQAQTALTASAPALMQACLGKLDSAHLRPPYISAANNACWALGLLVGAVPSEAIVPIVLPSAEVLVLVLQGSVAGSGAGEQKRMRENAGITLGRIAARAPDALAPHLSSFLGIWCNALGQIVDGEEKAAAFEGMLSLIQRNTDAVFASFTSLCAAIASWQRPPDSLLAAMRGLLHQLKARLVANGDWDRALARVHSELGHSPHVARRIAEWAGA